MAKKFIGGHVPGKVDGPVRDCDGPGPSCSNAWLQSGRPREERLDLRIGEAEIERLEACPSGGSRVRFAALQGGRLLR